MQLIRRHVLMASALTLILGAAGSHSYAQAPPIEKLMSVAADICVKPDLYGYTRAASGKIGGSLNGPRVVAKLLDLGLDANVAGQARDWRGIPANDLASGLADYRVCSREVYRLMFTHFYQQAPATTPAPPRREPPSCLYPFDLVGAASLHALEGTSSRVIGTPARMNPELVGQGWKFIRVGESAPTVHAKPGRNRQWGGCSSGRIESVGDDGIVASGVISNNAGRKSNIRVHCNLVTTAFMTHESRAFCPLGTPVGK